MWNENERPRIIFTGGGTLGHLMPGLCVLDEMKSRWPDLQYLFVGGMEGPEGDFLKRAGAPVRTLAAPRWSRTALLRPGFYRRITSSLVGAARLVRRFEAHAVVGLGGYASLPVSMAAAAHGVPTVLLEQNAIPGKANRLLSRWATRVCSAWRGAEAHFAHPERVRVTGNPIRRDIAGRLPRGIDEFGLDPWRKTVLVLGGSRGAVALNEAMAAALPTLQAERERIQVLHAAGPANSAATDAAYRAAGIRAAVHPFIENMAAAYGIADVVLCRAGGTTLAEVCAAGKPAVLVPYPYAAEKHQHANADVFVRAGAALMIDQGELTGPGLGRMLLNLLANDLHRRRMAHACLRLARPCAAALVVEEIEGCLHGRAGARATAARVKGENAWAW